MTYVELLDMARQTAAAVVVQWRGVDIDRGDIERELRAHWAGSTDESDEYIALVAREIGRIYADDVVDVR